MSAQKGPKAVWIVPGTDDSSSTLKSPPVATSATETATSTKASAPAVSSTTSAPTPSIVRPAAPTGVSALANAVGLHATRPSAPPPVRPASSASKPAPATAATTVVPSSSSSLTDTSVAITESTGVQSVAVDATTKDTSISTTTTRTTPPAAAASAAASAAVATTTTVAADADVASPETAASSSSPAASKLPPRPVSSAPAPTIVRPTIVLPSKKRDVEQEMVRDRVLAAIDAATHERTSSITDAPPKHQAESSTTAESEVAADSDSAKEALMAAIESAEEDRRRAAVMPPSTSAPSVDEGTKVHDRAEQEAAKQALLDAITREVERSTHRLSHAPAQTDIGDDTKSGANNYETEEDVKAALFAAIDASESAKTVSLSSPPTSHVTSPTMSRRFLVTTTQNKMNAVKRSPSQDMAKEALLAAIDASESARTSSLGSAPSAVSSDDGLVTPVVDGENAKEAVMQAIENASAERTASLASPPTSPRNSRRFIATAPPPSLANKTLSIYAATVTDSEQDVARAAVMAAIDAVEVERTASLGSAPPASAPDDSAPLPTNDADAKEAILQAIDTASAERTSTLASPPTSPRTTKRFIATAPPPSLAKKTSTVTKHDDEQDVARTALFAAIDADSQERTVQAAAVPPPAKAKLPPPPTLPKTKPAASRSVSAEGREQESAKVAVMQAIDEQQNSRVEQLSSAPSRADSHQNRVSYVETLRAAAQVPDRKVYVPDPEQEAAKAALFAAIDAASQDHAFEAVVGKSHGASVSETTTAASSVETVTKKSPAATEAVAPPPVQSKKPPPPASKPAFVIKPKQSAVPPPKWSGVATTPNSSPAAPKSKPAAGPPPLKPARSGSSITSTTSQVAQLAKPAPMSTTPAPSSKPAPAPASAASTVVPSSPSTKIPPAKPSRSATESAKDTASSACKSSTPPPRPPAPSVSGAGAGAGASVPPKPTKPLEETNGAGSDTVYEEASVYANFKDAPVQPARPPPPAVTSASAPPPPKPSRVSSSVEASTSSAAPLPTRPAPGVPVISSAEPVLASDEDAPVAPRRVKKERAKSRMSSMAPSSESPAGSDTVSPVVPVAPSAPSLTVSADERASRATSAAYERSVSDVDVFDIEKITTPSKHYVYKIRVFHDDGSEEVVQRRYSQFHALAKELKPVAAASNLVLPDMPDKILFGRSALREVAEKRRVDLNGFLKALVHFPVEISHNISLDVFLHETTSTGEEDPELFEGEEASAVSEPLPVVPGVAVGGADAAKVIADNRKERSQIAKGRAKLSKADMARQSVKLNAFGSFEVGLLGKYTIKRLRSGDAAGDSKAAELARERVRQENREVAREAVSAIVKENTVLVSQADLSGTLKEVLAVFESGAQVVDSSGGVILNLALTKIAFLISHSSRAFALIHYHDDSALFEAHVFRTPKAPQVVALIAQVCNAVFSKLLATRNREEFIKISMELKEEKLDDIQQAERLIAKFSQED